MRYTNPMNQEIHRRVASCAAGFALPRYAELPQVGLYLDQAVQYVNGCFRAFPGVELTPSMVSNYVKKGIISHPVKKKYTREQLASHLYRRVQDRPPDGEHPGAFCHAAGPLYRRRGLRLFLP